MQEAGEQLKRPESAGAELAEEGGVGHSQHGRDTNDLEHVANNYYDPGAVGDGQASNSVETHCGHTMPQTMEKDDLGQGTRQNRTCLTMDPGGPPNEHGDTVDKTNIAEPEDRIEVRAAGSNIGSGSKLAQLNRLDTDQRSSASSMGKQNLPSRNHG